MSHTVLPRLRDDAIVRPFDDRGEQARYVVALDGRHFVVTPTVAAVLDETRNLRIGECHVAALAERVTRRLGREVPAHQIETLLRHRAPRSFFEAGAESVAETSPIQLRCLLMSGARLRPLLALLGPLFTARTAFALCAAILTVDAVIAWQIWHREVAPLTAADQLCAFALTLLGIFFHELGHLSACHRFGGRHGGIGVGLYWCLPAFYAEVHGAWLLPRRQRAAVDIAGIYLQAAFVMVLGAAYLCTQAPALLSAIACSYFLMLHTLNPVLKFDGYWLLCDLAGIHNLHRSLRELVRRIFFGNRPNRAELGLLAAFGLMASVYFTYVIGMLGNGLGDTVAGLRAAWLVADGSAASSFGILGRAAWLGAMLAMALGIAVLLAKASRNVATGTSVDADASAGTNPSPMESGKPGIHERNLP